MSAQGIPTTLYPSVFEICFSLSQSLTKSTNCVPDSDLTILLPQAPKLLGLPKWATMPS